ncbi:MAG TPA: hypothetical protein VF899_13205 [Pyrinomonadaceae bacterium]
MLTPKEKQVDATTSPARFKLRWIVLLKDLSFFGSVSLAQLMVWRVLRRLRHERAARLKRIKLVPDANDEKDK